MRKDANGNHIHSFNGLTGRWIDDKLIFKDRNFTSSDYYSNTYMMSHYKKDGSRYLYFVTIGSRGRGKTFSGKKSQIKWVKAQIEDIMTSFNNGSIRKFMWWRLTTDAVIKVIQNNGTKFFEKKLLDKYNICLKIVNQDIFFAKTNDLIKNEDGEEELNYIHVGSVAAIQEYYKYKGNQLEDYDEIIMDELVRAKSERKTFDIPSAFINMIENVARTRKGIRVRIFANAINEMQEIRQLFGFMPLPGKFGIYKLWNKRTIIEYLDDSKEWKEQQEQTMAGLLKGKRSEFTNLHVDPLEDREDFIIKRKYIKNKTYFASIKIDRGRWLDISSVNGYYYFDTDSIKPRKNRYAIDRELVTIDTIFSKDIIKFIQEVWSVGNTRFSSNMCFEWFTKACDKYNII